MFEVKGWLARVTLLAYLPGRILFRTNKQSHSFSEGTPLKFSYEQTPTPDDFRDG